MEIKVSNNWGLNENHNNLITLQGDPNKHENWETILKFAFYKWFLIE